MAALTAALALAALSTSVVLGASREGSSVIVIDGFSGGSTSFNLSLKGRAGLRLQVEAERDGSVVLTVSKRRQSNDYLSQGTVSKDGDIEARFAHFGRIAVEFSPRGEPKPEKQFPGCRGKPTMRQAGVFAGRIRFHGERGFAEFAADHARGEEVKTSPLHCGGGGHQEPEAESGEEAALVASTPRGSLSFFAFGRKSQGRPLPPLIVATERHRVGPVLEFRNAFANPRSPGSFEFDQALSAATVRPGLPFHGTGVFQRGADGAASWTGSLRASFLGGDEALTGGRIEARLERPQRRRLLSSRLRRATLGAWGYLLSG